LLILLEKLFLEFGGRPEFRSAGPQQMAYQRSQKQYEERDKKYLRDPGGGASDAGETQKPGHEGYYQERQCPA
jgi:hypothetical protein